MGVLRLGQPLKSFRDRKVKFDIYKEDAKSPYLNSLGQLNKPTRFEQIKEVLQNEEALIPIPATNPHPEHIHPHTSIPHG